MIIKQVKPKRLTKDVIFQDPPADSKTNKEVVMGPSVTSNPVYCYELTDKSLSAANLFDQSGLPLQPLQTHFNIPEFDECLSKYDCSVAGAQKLTGNLFLYNSRICFFSRTGVISAGFTKPTLISIPFTLIKSISRAKTLSLPVTDFSILLILKDASTIRFIGFKSQKEFDQAHSHITQLNSWQEKLAPNLEDISVEYIRTQLSQIRASESSIIELDNEIEEEWEEIVDSNETTIPLDIQEIPPKNESPNDQFQARSTKITKQVLENAEVQLKAKWTTLKLQKITAKEVFILFFGNNCFEDDMNVTHDNFSIFYAREILKERDVICGEIHPEPPQYFSDLYCNDTQGILTNEFSQRTSSFTHISKDSLIPSTCKCVLKEKIYWVSPKELLVERDISFQGFPLSDSFQPRAIYHILESSDSSSTNIHSGFYIRFMKDTWFKSAIEKSAQEENNKNIDKLIPTLIKYSALWIKNREQVPFPLKSKPQQQKYLATQQDFGKPLKKESSPPPPICDIIELDNDDEPADSEKQIEKIAEASYSICAIF